MVFVTDDDEFVVELKNVKYGPNVGYSLFSPSAEFDGTWDKVGGPDRIMTAFEGRVTFRHRNGMMVATAYRIGEERNMSVLPALVPHSPPRLVRINVNDFRCIYGHAGEHLLKMTAKRLGVELEGVMHECTGCSMAKGFRKGIPHKTDNRATVKLGRLFVDLGGKKLTSVGGKQYPMIIKDDYSRRMWIYFLQRKSDAGNAFRNFLADVRADGFPSEMQVVRSDNGGEFFGGEFKYVCRELLIKQEFTPAHSPQFNGVAKRG